MKSFTESIVEQAAVAWFESLGWRVTDGIDIAAGEAGAERADMRSWYWKRDFATR